jgi:hypothetical protein
MVFDWLASDWTFAALLLLAALAFIWNGARRITWENRWKDQTLPIPESMVFYGARELRTFAGAARRVSINGQSGLSFYANKILRGCDLAYALALSTITAYVWFRIALAYAPTAPQSWLSSAIVWFAPYFAAMAVIYGAADIAEDLKLASILQPRGQDDEEAEIDRAEAAAANMLTILKMLSLLLSVIGFVLFLLLRWLQSITKGLSGTASVAMDEFLKWLYRLFGRKQPVPTPARAGVEG